MLEPQTCPSTCGLSGVMVCTGAHTRVVTSPPSSIRAHTLLYWEEILPNYNISFPRVPHPHLESEFLEPQLH